MEIGILIFYAVIMGLIFFAVGSALNFASRALGRGLKGLIDRGRGE